MSSILSWFKRSGISGTYSEEVLQRDRSSPMHFVIFTELADCTSWRVEKNSPNSYRQPHLYLPWETGVQQFQMFGDTTYRIKNSLSSSSNTFLTIYRYINGCLGEPPHVLNIISRNKNSHTRFLVICFLHYVLIYVYISIFAHAWLIKKK